MMFRYIPILRAPQTGVILLADPQEFPLHFQDIGSVPCNGVGCVRCKNKVRGIVRWFAPAKYYKQNKTYKSNNAARADESFATNGTWEDGIVELFDHNMKYLTEGECVGQRFSMKKVKKKTVIELGQRYDPELLRGKRTFNIVPVLERVWGEKWDYREEEEVIDGPQDILKFRSASA